MLSLLLETMQVMEPMTRIEPDKVAPGGLAKTHHSSAAGVHTHNLSSIKYTTAAGGPPLDCAALLAGDSKQLTRNPQRWQI